MNKAPLLPASAQPYAKAIIAALGAICTSLLTTLPDNATVQTVCPIISSLVTALGVLLVPNTDPTAEHQDESVQPPEVEAEEPVGIGVPVAASKPHPRHLADD